MDGPKAGVYHEGERAVQRRAGVRRQAERLADMVGAAVPDGEDVRSLVADQPHAVVTSVDPGVTLGTARSAPSGTSPPTTASACCSWTSRTAACSRPPAARR
jgi:predicted pyridoxine 5'-phosphate oxidase superfamily flavin-nucleotide-binding protein